MDRAQLITLNRYSLAIAAWLWQYILSRLKAAVDEALATLRISLSPLHIPPCLGHKYHPVTVTQRQQSQPSSPTPPEASSSPAAKSRWATQNPPAQSAMAQASKAVSQSPAVVVTLNTGKPPGGGSGDDAYILGG